MHSPLSWPHQNLDAQPCTSEIFDSLVSKFVCTGFCIFSISRPVVQEDRRWTASEDTSLKQQAEALLLNLYQILISLNSSTYLQERINALKNSYVIHRYLNLFNYCLEHRWTFKFNASIVNLPKGEERDPNFILSRNFISFYVYKVV